MKGIGNLALAITDSFAPLAYATGKGTAAIYAFSHLNDNEPLMTAVKCVVGGYCALSGLVESARFLRGINTATLHPDKEYRTNGNFAPLEVAVVRNLIVERHNAKLKSR